MDILKNFDTLLNEYGSSTQAVADELCITPQSLRTSLRNNPSLARLKAVANAIGCPITALLDCGKDEVFGIVFIDGQTTIIKSRADLDAFVLHNMKK